MIVTDYNGYVVDFKGAEHEAIEKGYNVDCIDCRRCVGCRRCTNCYKCVNCTNCTHCTNTDCCFDCTECNYSRDMHNCHACASCSMCQDCKNCTRSKTLNNCSHVWDCTEVVDTTITPIQVKTDDWTVTIYLDKDMVSIGCQSHSRNDWMTFTNTCIKEMAYESLEWWKRYKPVVRALIKANPLQLRTKAEPKNG